MAQAGLPRLIWPARTVLIRAINAVLPKGSKPERSELENWSSLV
jgi:hypothetical protein